MVLYFWPVSSSNVNAMVEPVFLWAAWRDGRWFDTCYLPALFVAGFEKAAGTAAIVQQCFVVAVELLG